MSAWQPAPCLSPSLRSSLSLGVAASSPATGGGSCHTRVAPSECPDHRWGPTGRSCSTDSLGCDSSAATVSSGAHSPSAGGRSGHARIRPSSPPEKRRLEA
eukprot:6367269-Prymnesium_polylepis.1